MIASILAAVMIVAHEPGYYTSLSRHLQRWLKGAEVSAEVITPAEMGRMKSSPVTFLVGFNEPSDAEMKQLAAYVGGGGKLVVFHSASPRLGALMGVRPTGYKTAKYPGCWSRMDFVKQVPPGFPDRILQSSTVLQSAAPIEGRSRVIAWWSDRTGKSTGDAAWLGSKQGYWMTHVLLADGDETLKAQLVAAICGSVSPALWNWEAFSQKRREAAARLRAYALKQVPRKGEIHAVWDHSGCGLYPGNWPKTFKVLQEARVTDLFVNVAGAGFAHYNSSVLPKSQTFFNEGDQLAACLQAAKGTGIRVHAWVLCFTATRSSPKTLADFRSRGWTLKTADGKDTEYLNPAHPEVQRHVLRAIEEINAKYRVDGVHLDFVRWYERSAKPPSAAPVIARFVAEARIRTPRPKWLTAAVLGKYPACVASVGQDWERWLDLNLVDYVVPMDYSEDMAKFESFLAQHAVPAKNARRIIAGLGVTANESRLDAKGVIDQIRLVRKHNLAGVSLFDLDTYLEKSVLPYLKLGIW